MEDSAAFPMNIATQSLGKVDHRGPYANQCGVAVGVVHNGWEEKKLREDGMRV